MLQVDGVQPVNIVIAVGIEGLGDHQRVTDVVHQHIKPAETRLDLLGQVCHLLLDGDIRLHHQGLGRAAFENTANVRCTRGIDLRDHQACARPGKGFDNRAANACSTASDQYCFSCEVHHPATLVGLSFRRLFAGATRAASS
ncbi:hypothetical protein D3C86_1727560 [compost metagenome]